MEIYENRRKSMRIIPRTIDFLCFVRFKWKIVVFGSARQRKIYKVWGSNLLYAQESRSMNCKVWVGASFVGVPPHAMLDVSVRWAPCGGALAV